MKAINPETIPGIELVSAQTVIENKIIFNSTIKAKQNVTGMFSLDAGRWTINVPAIRVLRFGFNMPGDPVGFYKATKDGFSSAISNSDKSFIAEDDKMCKITSNSLLCFKAENSDEITLTGAASFQKTEGTIELTLNKQNGSFELTYKMRLDGISLKAGQVLELDDFVIMTGSDLNALLKQWAELTAQTCGSLLPETIPTGWNDWQYYRNEKTARDVLDSAEVIADMKQHGYPLDFVQVDGGFCIHLSEWTLPKTGFQPGIKALSKNLRTMGLKFGLWFAPYIQNINTSVVKNHPEWLLKNDAGQPVILGNSNVGQSCLIDYTVPCTEEWLREQLRLFVDEWQVKWIKLDGPNYALYRQGRLNNRSLTISEMLNRTFEIIREEAGSEVLVEGEGMMGLALGKVELHRVQTDNHPKWYANNCSDSEYAPKVYGKELIMSFLHNRWWCNHRENVILRNYPSEFCYDRLSNHNAVEQAFTEPEFRTQLTAAVMGSGGLLLTDPMKELVKDRERFAWISKLLPVYNKAAEIVDAFPDGRYPAIYRIKVNEDQMIYSFTNWSDRICDLECDLPTQDDFYAYSVFEQKVYGVFNKRLKISGITAHDSRIVVLKKRKNAPCLLATDLHLLPGTVDVRNCSWHDGTLELEICHFKQDDNRLYFAANGYKILDIATNAIRFTVDDFDIDYPVIRFQGNPGCTIFKIEWINK
jgi:alpha-galactosidase